MSDDSPKDIQGALALVNARVFGPDSRLVLEYVRFEDLREQDLNANAMPQEMFVALVGNIQRSGALESMPLVANRQGSDVLEVVSGHHRIRSARRAGITHGLVLRYKDLTLSEIRAKQLAHNSIAGTSDPQLVTELFNQIDGVDLQLEAFIDPKAIGKVPEAVSFKQIDIDPLVEAKTVTIVFLPTQVRDFERAIELLSDNPDEIYLAHREAFDGFRDAIQRMRKDLNTKAMPTALCEMARIAIDYCDNLSEDGGTEGSTE